MRRPLNLERSAICVLNIVIVGKLPAPLSAKPNARPESPILAPVDLFALIERGDDLMNRAGVFRGAAATGTDDVGAGRQRSRHSARHVGG